MPDTGAPWNIPYVESADLVSDWPADSLLVANAVAAGLSAAGNAGIGTNVVNANKTTSFTTTSATYTSSGLEVTITPSSATSKIYVVATLSLGYSSATAGRIFPAALFRDATEIGSGTDGFHYIESSGVNITNKLYACSINLLDSPATTSAITYSIRLLAPSGDTIAMNRPGIGTTSNLASSQLTAIEVAA